MKKVDLSDNCFITLDEEKQIFTAHGIMRLQMQEYQSVKDMLQELIDSYTGHVVLDLKDLVFLNSSGITVFSMFVIKAKKTNTFTLDVIGSEKNILAV